MGMTMAEKILASHSGRKQVRPGEYVWATIDETNVTTSPLTPEFSPVFQLEQLGIDRVFDPDRVYTRNDQVPKSIAMAEQDAATRRFAKKYGLRHWFEYGRHGVMHQLFPEQGYVRPGELVAMGDSHSTTYGAFNAASCGILVEEVYVVAKGRLWFKVPETIKFWLTGKLPPMCVGKDVVLKIAADYGTDVALYKSVEFLGPTATEMSLASRWTMSNMGVEIGAKFAIFEADEKTFTFLEGRTDRPYTPVRPDPDAAYEKEYVVDVSELEPMVACPNDPGNSKPVSAVAGVKINQAFIGSCTNGRQEDPEMAARILKGRKVHPDVRLLVSPASMEVWKDALRAGWIQTIVEAEGMVYQPTCSPCNGFVIGILAAGERCISSSNRNFQGRMGSPQSEVYLANAATVAASAIAGEITDPRKL